MKQDEINKLKDMSLPSLQNQLEEEREKLSDLKFKLAVGKQRTSVRLETQRKRSLGF